MVATLVRLKLRILRHTLRRETWRLVLLVLGALWGLSMVPSVVGGMMWLDAGPLPVAQDVLVVGGSVLLLGWAVIPVLVPGMDDSLEIDRFATSGRSAARLAPGLLVAGAVSLPTLITAGLVVSPVLLWRHHGAVAAVAAVVAGLVALVTCLLLARVATGLSARVLSSRRSRETGAILGVLAVVTVVPVILTLGSLGMEGVLERVPAIAGVLGWTPLGAPFAVPGLLAAGDAGGATGRALVALLGAVGGYVLWVRLLDRALTRPPSRGGQVRRRPDAVLPRRAVARHPGLVAAAAVARRGARYWTADPRYMSALLGAVVAPVLIVLLVAAVSKTPAAVALSLATLVGGTLGWGRHNDLAFDGSAFWLHVAAHVPGWADRLGRSVATLVWALPAMLVIGLGGVALSGRWELTAAALGAGTGVLLGGLAVSAVVSATLPYPVPEAGANPYAAQMGAVGATLVAQLVSSLATTVVCAPVLVLYFASLWHSADLAGVTLAVGVLGGGATLAGAIVLGGRLYDARAPHLLARLV